MNAPLYTLDETTWDTLGDHPCRELAWVVIGQVTSAVASLQLGRDLTLRVISVPELPPDVRVSDLELEVRTFNCLKKEGLIDDSQRLRALKIADLLAIPGFGAKSLVDFLTSVETYLAKGPIHGNTIVQEATLSCNESDRNESRRRRRVRVVIQRFPRRGYPLVPRVLFQALSEVGSSGDVGRVKRIYDLGLDVWDSHSVKECRSLVTEVAGVLGRYLGHFPASVYHSHVWNGEVEPPTRITVGHRTYSRLKKGKYLDDPIFLAQLTVGQLLHLRGFGVKSLIDVLASLEVLRESEPYSTRSPEPPSPRETPPDVIPDKDIALEKIRVVVEHFPRRGYPLIPAAIRQTILNLLPRDYVGTARELLALGDRVWEPQWREQRKRLMGTSIRSLGDACLSILPSEVLNQSLYSVGLKHRQTLRVSRRTFNCLRQAGLLADNQRLARTRVRDLLHIRGFGAMCLLDMLSSLESSSQEEPRTHAIPGHGVSTTLEDELTTIGQLAEKGRERTIVEARFGLDCREPKTLVTIAQRVHLTRERVRQVCHSFQLLVQERRPPSPLLDEVIEYVCRSVPCRAGDVIPQLRKRSLIRGPIEIQCLKAVSELLERPLTFEITRECGDTFLLPTGLNLSLLASLAKKNISKWGVTTVDEIAANPMLASPNTARFLSNVLPLLPGFRWLDQQNGWFWLVDVERNRLVRRIGKILAVASCVHVSELRSAIGRDYSFRSFSPPRRILLELCRQIPGLIVDENVVRGVHNVGDTEQVSSSAEARVVDIIRKHGPLVTVQQLSDLCVQCGVAHSSLIRTLTYSPLVVRFGPATYGLVGSPIPPGLVEDIQRYSRRRGKVLIDYGWIKGRVWLAYRLTMGMLRSGCFAVPASMREMLQGELILCTADRNRVGVLHISGSGAWGITSLFRRRGGDPGDCLVLVIDIKEQQATAYLGDDHLLEDVRMGTSELVFELSSNGGNS